MFAFLRGTSRAITALLSVRPADPLDGLHKVLGPSNMLAYLAMMTPRLIELRRVLRATGSLSLHCDPTASHHLKLLLDAVFGPENFRKEIIWQRTAASIPTLCPG